MHRGRKLAREGYNCSTKSPGAMAGAFYSWMGRSGTLGGAVTGVLLDLMGMRLGDYDRAS